MVKGISPLVATVLLIAITMTLAGILAFWGSSFVRGGLPTEEETQRFRKCTQAINALRIDFSSYNETNKTLFLAIYNSSPVTLNLTNASFFYPTTYIQREVNKESRGGGITVILLENIEPGYLKYTIYTDCPEVRVEGK